jgi:hypothetical protein
MAGKIPRVRIALKETPVIIQSLKGDQVSAEYALWDDIAASEFFPPSVNSAFYILSLEKPVSQASEVWVVESELIEALELLAAAWPFSGGGFIILETRKLPHAPRYESNAKEIETDLFRQARQGFADAAARVHLIHEDVATYRQPPLGTAVRLAKVMRENPALNSLLSYHQQACVEYYHPQRAKRPSWFIDLYKVREVLKEIYAGEAKARSLLNISNSDWSFFGRILNNYDLRHAKVSGMAQAVPVQDVDRVYRLARSWIQTHLLRQGLPVVLV